MDPALGQCRRPARPTEKRCDRPRLLWRQYSHFVVGRRRARLHRQHWLTFRQALKIGAHVKKGEKGTTVVYADRFIPYRERTRVDETGDEPEAIPFLKRFTVFNADQCEDLPEGVASAPMPPAENLILPQAEALIRATGADIRIGGNRAFYVPSDDFIQVPPPSSLLRADQLAPDGAAMS